MMSSEAKILMERTRIMENFRPSNFCAVGAIAAPGTVTTIIKSKIIVGFCERDVCL